MDEHTAGDWDEAVALARTLDGSAAVRLPKSVAPALPPDLDVRRANFPWSIHKGADAVYRETERGEHLQVREYPAAWVVTTDDYNPRARPLSHATRDVPVTMLVAMATLTPVRSYRWVFGERVPSPASTIDLTAAALGKGADLGRELLPLA